MPKKQEYYNDNFFQRVDDGDYEDDRDNNGHLQGVEFLVDHCNAFGVPCAPVGHYLQLLCNLP